MILRDSIRDIRDDFEALEDEKESLRDMLNDVPRELGLGGDVRYYSDDNYEECHETVMKELRKRLMPKGFEWPRFEDDTLVQTDDSFCDGLGDIRTVTSIELICNEDACDALIHWDEDDPDNYLLVCIRDGDKVKRPAVPAADGVPIKKGETVWHEDGTELKVLGFGDKEDGEILVYVEYVSGPTRWASTRSLSLTHTKPEQDSWEKWRESFIKPPCVYCRDILGVEFDEDTELGRAFDAQAQDMERRARALAGVSE